jgi:hypothetical protein
VQRSPGGYEQERAELAALLDSGIFQRAPNLSQLLTYICDKYFEGHAADIKEYNVGVEALGRPAGFDQKRDSIVRVEAHRLRKRLNEYYSGPGAQHQLRIEVPPGQYAPRFRIQNEFLVPEPVSEPEVPTPERPGPEPTRADAERQAAPSGAGFGRWIALLILGVGVALTLVAFSLNRGGSVTESPQSVPLVASRTEETRILVGLESGTYVDRCGRIWSPDRYYQGGTIVRTSHLAIAGAMDPALYQSRREGAFSYDIPLKPGTYELRLHFAETLYGERNLAGGGETSRIFRVWINEAAALHDFDVIADAGASTADIKVFKDISPAQDGALHLRFEEVTNQPFLNAIELLPAQAGRMETIRLTARETGYTDRTGRPWMRDSYSRGGQLVLRSDPVQGTTDPELYRGERFGNLTYVIPVPPGRYTVNLHFSEQWFGPRKPAAGGAGSRVFDILCNGVLLNRDFDIFREAGGSDVALVRTFRHLEPNHQGKLVISLIPARNYASINALEVLDEARPAGRTQ